MVADRRLRLRSHERRARRTEAGGRAGVFQSSACRRKKRARSPRQGSAITPRSNRHELSFFSVSPTFPSPCELCATECASSAKTEHSASSAARGFTQLFELVIWKGAPEDWSIRRLIFVAGNTMGHEGASYEQSRHAGAVYQSSLKTQSPAPWLPRDNLR